MGEIMKKTICNYYNGNKTSFLCETCKNYYNCNLIQPTNENHLKLLHEKNYWLNKLDEVKECLKDYETILNDIKKGAYLNSVNVYGNIQYYPQTNCFNVFIKKPEHVRYGLNYQYLLNYKKELIERVRGLNRKEFNMRKILNKRSMKK